MKISVQWLNEYLDQPVTADAAARVLDAQGFPVETQTALPDGDTLLDVEVTSNRWDCLNHLGVAREVAAGLGRTLRLPAITLPTGVEPAAATLADVVNNAPAVCPVYTARVIRGVKVGPSPAWLRRHLEAVGLRSVNNVVDITNFVLLELGQPLHAFDLAKLQGQQIVVRLAKAGEAFTAIDSTQHKLTDRMLVIADAARPVAIAGVMGGLDSEVTAATTDILLESAQFDPLSVRTTSRRLKLSSDSSFRFERGLDRTGIERASQRAAALILELAGGQLASGVIRAGEADPAPAALSMRLSRCKALLGYDIAPARMVELLASLGLQPQLDGDHLTCVLPHWRNDLEREVDLIEEIARMHGLAEVPINEQLTLTVRPPQPKLAARKALAKVLLAHGYHETINFSFVGVPAAKAFTVAGASAVSIGDERRKAEPMLRPSLLPSLLTCRKSNQDVGNHDLRLFETASTWEQRGQDSIETRRLALLADSSDNQLALRDLRGVLEELTQTLGVEVACTPTTLPWCSAAMAVKLTEGKTIGWYGVLNAATRKLFDLQTELTAGEVELEPLLTCYPPQRKVQALPRIPGIERDLSVIVDETVTWERIAASALATEPALLERMWFITTYRGKPIPPGRKSVSFRMLFRDPAATLRHEQVDPQVAGIVERLKQEVGAELRG